jgi:4-hydroxybenzoate polyprenyltransferase
MGFLRHIVHFLDLIRWRNILIIIFTQLFAYVFLYEEQCVNLTVNYNFILVCASTILLAAAGYMINDYSDVRIDVINKPDKLIVERYIPRRVVFTLHLVFNFFGVAIALLVNPWFALINIIIAFTLWQYSIRFKYYFFAGNMLVAALMAMTLLVVYFATNQILIVWLAYYTVFAFLTGLIREVIKDIEDMEGDASFGAKTLPNTLGIPKTKIIIYYLMLLTLSLLIFSCAYLFYKDYIILPVYLILTTAIPLAVFFQRTMVADSKKDFSRLSRMIKFIMLAGVVSMSLRCAVY